ncbi:hypothetical protein D3C85_994460 [compost metagenome]
MRAPAPATDWPSNVTCPDVGVSTPEIWLNIVLLPAPLGPISARISPARISRFMALLATRPPNLRVTSTAFNTTSPRAGMGLRGSGSAFMSRRRTGFFTRIQRVNNGHKPLRARCSSSTMPKPNTMTSKLPVWPSTLGSQSCNHCLATVNTPAPTSAPQTWPAPPMTVMNRYSMPICRPKGLGFTKRCMWAYNQPDAQACSAAMMKITMRERAVSTPMDSAITRPPLSARMARPSRESSRFCVDQTAISRKAQIR